MKLLKSIQTLRGGGQTSNRKLLLIFLAAIMFSLTASLAGNYNHKLKQTNNKLSHHHSRKASNDDETTTNSNNTDTEGVGIAMYLTFISVIILGGLLYFLPTIVAIKGKHKNRSAIFLLNLFTGFSVVGWIIAVVWAVAKD